LLGPSAGTSASPSVAGGGVYYTQNVGEIGGFGAPRRGGRGGSPAFPRLPPPPRRVLAPPGVLQRPPGAGGARGQGRAPAVGGRRGWGCGGPRRRGADVRGPGQPLPAAAAWRGGWPATASNARTSVASGAPRSV